MTHGYRLVESWEIIDRSRFDTCRPPRGDSFHSGIEMDGFRTIDVMISKKTLLPTAKTMKGNRNRNRHVNSNHPHFDAAHKIPGGITITGKNRSSCLLYTSDAADE